MDQHISDKEFSSISNIAGLAFIIQQQPHIVISNFSKIVRQVPYKYFFIPYLISKDEAVQAALVVEIERNPELKSQLVRFLKQVDSFPSFEEHVNDATRAFVNSWQYRAIEAPLGPPEVERSLSLRSPRSGKSVRRKSKRSVNRKKSRKASARRHR
jgi:hypothetical protein